MSVVSDHRSAGSASPAVPAHVTRTSRRPATHALVALGVLLVALGAYLPWLVIFNGLTNVPGFRLGGGPPAGVVVGAAGLVLVAIHRGGGRWLRPVAAAASVAVTAYVLYIAQGVLGYVADPGPTGPLFMPQAGVGAYAMAGGAVCVLAAAVIARPVPAPLSRSAKLRLGIAALTFAAGWVHLLLAPEHLEEHTLLGIGFVVAGVAQVALAVLVVARPHPTSLSLVVALDVAIMAVYLYAVVVGLPFGDSGMADMPGMTSMPGMDGGHDMASTGALDMSGMDMDHGLVLGSGEPVDVVGAVTFLAELIGVGLIVAYLRGKVRR